MEWYYDCLRSACLFRLKSRDRHFICDPMQIILLTLTCCLFFSTTISAVTRNVPGEYETIQSAIEATVRGDLVLVQPGIYVERLDFLGKEITVASLIYLNLDSVYADSTIIVGSREGHVVSFTSGETENSVLWGFTVLEGLADYGGGIYIASGSSPRLVDLIVTSNMATTNGAGIYCCGNSRPTMQNVKVEYNQSDGDGGGIGITGNAYPVLRNVLLADNMAGGDGGGIYVSGGGLDFETGFIYNNLCDGMGSAIVLFASYEDRLVDLNIKGHSGNFGAVYIDSASPLLENCCIDSNESTGLYCWFDASPEIRNCVISRNTGRGGGIYGYIDSYPRIYNTLFCYNSGIGAALFSQAGDFAMINCTVVENQASGVGMSASVYAEAGEVVLINNIILNRENERELYIFAEFDSNMTIIDHCNIPQGEGAITGDGDFELNWMDGNRFSEPGFVDEERGDFNLSEESPCVDAGTGFFMFDDDTLLNLTEEDYFGFAPDIGALESEFVHSIKDHSKIPLNTDLLSCYPNPANSDVSLRMNLETAGNVSLSLCDLSGGHVADIFKGYLNSGISTTNWHSGSIATGTYLVKLELGKHEHFQKLIILK